MQLELMTFFTSDFLTTDKNIFKSTIVNIM